MPRSSLTATVDEATSPVIASTAVSLLNQRLELALSSLVKLVVLMCCSMKSNKKSSISLTRRARLVAMRHKALGPGSASEVRGPVFPVQKF